MKKFVLFSLISLVTCIPQLHSISLIEHIRQNGRPQIFAGILDLSCKDLSDISGLQDIPGIDKVEYLDLSNNQLETLPATSFNGLSNLQTLSLASNKLKELSDTIFNGLNLTNLDLANNQLQALSPTIFSDLPNLELLYLSRNQLPMLPENIFNNLSNLQKLDLSRNKLQTLPAYIFNNLSQLCSLKLKHNNFNPDFIVTLNYMIDSIANLEELNGKSKDQALREQPFSTLKQATADFIAKNIGTYRNRLDKLPSDALDLVEQMPKRRKIEQ